MAIKEIGKVNENLEPIIKIQFTNGAEIDCVVDTGFNGTLFLPRDFIKQNDFAVIGEESFHSVGQDEAQLAEVFSAKVMWLGDELEVGIIVSEYGSALIGAEMMIHAKLEIDYTKSTVSIEKA